MPTITPMLDTLLPQVFGRLGDLERFSATRVNSPLAAITAIKGGQAPAGRGDALFRASMGQQSATASPRGPSGAATTAQSADSVKQAPGQAGAANARPGAQALPGNRHISRAGLSLSALFQRFPVAPKAGPTHSGALMAAGNSLQPAALAAVLGDQVSQSGVFYEAHLLQWFEGRRGLLQMQAESAARFKALSSDSSALPTNAEGEQKTPVDDRLMPVVRQQLDVLQHGVFRWQGQAWPGVPMDWQIETPPPDDRGESHDGAAGEPAAEYATSLRLDMPRLGTVEMRLTIAGNRIQVYTWAEQASGARILDADVATLRSRLQDLGFDAASVTVVDEQSVP